MLMRSRLTLEPMYTVPGRGRRMSTTRPARRPAPHPREPAHDAAAAAGRAVRAVRRADPGRARAISSTSSSAASCARAAGAELLFTPRRCGRGPLQGGARPVPRVPRAPAVARPVGRAADPRGRGVLLRNSTLDRVCAFYPSPAGATESLLPLDTWDELVGAHPELADARARRRGVPRARRPATTAGECFLVPIDACYELVGQLRRLWRGFDGGSEARDALDAFFSATCRARAR